VNDLISLVVTLTLAGVLVVSLGFHGAAWTLGSIFLTWQVAYRVRYGYWMAAD
jgi:O-antigen/teichoic acid export membrane protein